jgi:serine protease
MRFTAWPAGGAQPADAQPVCRFFGTPGIGPNSHFFTADTVECAAVRRDPRWIDEGISFRARLPANGACAAGDAPLRRLWWAGADATASRHRYVTDPALVAPMIAAGWVLEGTVMCVAAGGG